MAAEFQPSVVIIAAVAGFAAGGVWYSVLGDRWMAAAGIGKEQVKSKSGARQGSRLPFFIAAIADLLIASILAMLLPAAGWQLGVLAGGVLWLGFVLPTTMVNYAFQMRPLTLTLIDAGHWLLVLTLMGAVLGFFGAE